MSVLCHSTSEVEGGVEAEVDLVQEVVAWVVGMAGREKVIPCGNLEHSVYIHREIRFSLSVYYYSDASWDLHGYLWRTDLRGAHSATYSSATAILTIYLLFDRWNPIGSSDGT